MDMYLGIDPGLRGALALYRPQMPSGDMHLVVIDMPTHTITINRKRRRVIDLHAVARFFDENKGLIVRATIEHPHAMPGQGVTSSFTFGFCCGAVQMGAITIPTVLLRPSAWKKMMALTADKDACRRRASQIFPDHALQWSRKRDDGRAEAVLLAYLGSKI